MFALEVSADPERLASEGDPAVDIDLSDLVVEVILGLGEGLWEGAAAHGVPAGRCNQTQCMVRTLKVVEVSPSVKATLAVGEVGVCPSLEQLGLEGPVEALELAKGLGMVRPAVDHSDT